MSLDNFIKENRKFIQLGDGESYQGLYQGAKEGLNQEGKPIVFYGFKDDANSPTITLKSTSIKLAVKMNKYKVGDCLKITRNGMAKETKYEVEEATPF